MVSLRQAIERGKSFKDLLCSSGLLAAIMTGWREKCVSSDLLPNAVYSVKCGSEGGKYLMKYV
jgi:hypothetical protein